MATRGRKPTPPVLKLITGNPGKRPIPPSGPEIAGKPVKPPALTARASELWDFVMGFASWLTVADTFKLSAWCERQADYERDHSAWTAADRREHRSSGSELGFDPASRRNLVVPSADMPTDPRSKYLA